jgi:uncharacterized membrane protein YphA (DoxX/SURF4 family)
MQRLFSMFPEGGPGVALLLLRISVVATFIMSEMNRERSISLNVFLVGEAFVCIALMIGFLTPISSILTCVSAVASMLLKSRVDIGLVCLAFNSVALALLGPGAYSLDARLFGRRVMLVSPRKSADRD